MELGGSGGGEKRIEVRTVGGVVEPRVRGRLRSAVADEIGREQPATRKMRHERREQRGRGRHAVQRDERRAATLVEKRRGDAAEREATRGQPGDRQGAAPGDAISTYRERA